MCYSIVSKLFFYTKGEKMQFYESSVSNMPELLDIIAAGASYGSKKNDRPVVVVKLDDGRSLKVTFETQTNEEGFMYGDVEAREDVVWDDNLIRPHLTNLLESSQSFFVVTGSSDSVCSLKWELVQNSSKPR